MSKTKLPHHGFTTSIHATRKQDLRPLLDRSLDHRSRPQRKQIVFVQWNECSFCRRMPRRRPCTESQDNCGRITGDTIACGTPLLSFYQQLVVWDPCPKKPHIVYRSPVIERHGQNMSLARHPRSSDYKANTFIDGERTVLDGCPGYCGLGQQRLDL